MLSLSAPLEASVETSPQGWEAGQNDNRGKIRASTEVRD